MNSEESKGEISVTQFLDAVASENATPGGGSVSALAGSLGSALVEMVANLTLRKIASAAHQTDIKRIIEEAHAHREALTATIAQDIAAYQEVIQAYLLPKTNEDEKRKRKEEIQKALKKAADPPLFTAATSLKVIKLCQEVLEKGDPRAAGDAAVGALMADAALSGGVFNVLINLSALEDKKYVQKMKKELLRLRGEGEKIKEEIVSSVRAKVNSL
jgi:formiminotetrahydrofolate cyclodeaminase